MFKISKFQNGLRHSQAWVELYTLYCEI